MKWILLFIFPVIIIIFFYSCGVNDSGMNPQKIVTVNKIYTMNIDGTNIKFLVYGDKAQFSPDGNKIYFGNLNTINIDGTDLQQLIPQNLSVGDYAFSDDYKKITFSTFYELYLMNIDGSSLIKLIPKDTSWDVFTNARISPNDSIIAYQFNVAIGIINSNGSNRKTLLVSDSANDFYNPVFTPDGKNLLFIQRNYFNEYFIYDYNFKTTGYSSIYSAHPTSGIEVSQDGFAIFSSDNNIQKLDLITHKDIILTAGYEESFSKGLNKIIFTKPNDPQKAIYIYDMNNGNITEIKSGLPWAVIQYPKLSPKGNLILFEADSTYTDGNYFN